MGVKQRQWHTDHQCGRWGSGSGHGHLSFHREEMRCGDGRNEARLKGEKFRCQSCCYPRRKGPAGQSSKSSKHTVVATVLLLVFRGHNEGLKLKRVVKEKETSQGTGDLIEKRVSHVRNKANKKIPPTTRELVSQLKLSHSRTGEGIKQETK